MSYYYRLASVLNTLPKHWAYCDAWEWVSDEKGSYWEDRRVPGFQVFGEASQALRALSGEDMDGVYEASEYPQILIVEADENFVSDGCSIYFALECEGVLSVRAMPSKEALDRILEIYSQESEQYDYDSFAEWCEDSEEEIAGFLLKMSEVIEVSFIETLPRPCLINFSESELWVA
ncbi:hypothetical protein QUB25_14200 [Microcoleus sp. B3-D7]